MQKHESAFTLIELMIAIAVAAVVLTLGVPGFGRVIERNQLSTNINGLVSTLHFARSEAIRRNKNITVCHSNDGSSCSGVGYEDGWIIFHDNNGDGEYADAGEERRKCRNIGQRGRRSHGSSLESGRTDEVASTGGSGHWWLPQLSHIALAASGDLTPSTQISYPRQRFFLHEADAFPARVLLFVTKLEVGL